MSAPNPAERADWLKSVMTWPRLFALVIAFLAASAMFEMRRAVLWPNPIPEKASPEEKKQIEELRELPDGRRFGYGAADLHRHFDAIGPHGRALYANTQLTLDGFFPLVYGCLFIAVPARLIPGRSRGLWWAWIPVLMVLIDYCENVTLACLAKNYSAEMKASWAGWAETASQFTVVKWWLYWVNLCALPTIALAWRLIDTGYIVTAWRKRRRQRAA